MKHFSIKLPNQLHATVRKRANDRHQSINAFIQTLIVKGLGEEAELDLQPPTVLDQLMFKNTIEILLLLHHLIGTHDAAALPDAAKEAKRLLQKFLKGEI